MTTQTKPRQSRASRAAAKADQDGVQDQPQQPQPPEPDVSETGHGGPLAERSTQPDPGDDQGDDQGDPDPDDGDQGDEPEATPKPKPEPAGPYATVTSEPVMMPYFRGVAEIRAVGPDGKAETVETVTCTCQWAHTTPEIAAKCGRKLASARGLRVKTAE